MNPKFWFPVFGYSAIIFYLSSIPAGAPILSLPIWDKLEHTLEYLPLGFLVSRALAHSKPWHKWGIWVFAALGGFAYGLSDEFHQSFVPGRESSIWDAGADFFGSAIGAGTYLFAIAKGRK